MNAKEYEKIIAALRSQLATVTAEREAMREIIEQLEWIADEYGIECRVCGKRKPHHRSSCELAAALKGGKG